MKITASISGIEVLRRFAEGVPGWAWVAIGAIVILRVFQAVWLPRLKGWMGERAVARGLNRLDDASYRSFHDLYLPRPDGRGTTQLDHVVASRFGVFVIETKNYQGWIFGSAKQRQLTQSIHKRKHRFQNPLHQNELHIRALAEFLSIDRGECHSVVFFIGGSSFKTELPSNVLDRGLMKHIEGFTEAILCEDEYRRISDQIHILDAGQDRKALAKAHVRALKAIKATPRPARPS